MSAVRALLMAVLLVQGASTRAHAHTHTHEDVDALRNATRAQVQQLREHLTHSAQVAAKQLVAELRDAVDAFVAEDEQLASGALPVAGEPGAGHTRSMGGSEPLPDLIRRVLREGLPSKGIPPLDPLKITRVPLELNVPGAFKLKAELNDISLVGLLGFEEDVDITYSFTVIPPKVAVTAKFEVLIPRIRFLTQYDAVGSVDAGLDLWGDGPLTVYLNRLLVKGNVAVSNRLLTIIANPCSIDVSSRSFELEIEGLLGGGLLSQIVSEIVTEMINEYIWKEIFVIISPIIETGVCTYLESKSATFYINLLIKILSMPYEPAASHNASIGAL